MLTIHRMGGIDSVNQNSGTKRSRSIDRMSSPGDVAVAITHDEEARIKDRVKRQFPHRRAAERNRVRQIASGFPSSSRVKKETLLP